MNQRKISGFTLVEVAMIVVVGGLMLAASTATLGNYLSQLRITTTQSRMQEIDNAIARYVDIYGQMPCPAALTDAQDSITFGRQLNNTSIYIVPHSLTYTNNFPPPSNPVVVSNDCYASTVNAPGGAFQSTAPILPTPLLDSPGNAAPLVSQGKIVTGAVPVRDLNLPEQDVADAWGDRFIYAVSDVLTINNTLSTYEPSQGSISVVDSSPVPKELTQPSPPGSTGQYVIISHGPDRAGAFTIGGVKGGTACPAGTPEALNCTFPPTNKFRKAAQSNGFDDLVIFHAQINSSSTETMPPGFITQFSAQTGVCPAGWITYAGDACLPSTNSPADYICCQKF